MGILSGLYNARQETKAAKEEAAANYRASEIAGKASADAIAEQRRQYDTTRADFAPYVSAGTGAVNRLNAASSGDMSSFYTSPDYNFQRTEGMRDIGNSFAARGGSASGNALKALSEYNSNLARGEYGNWWNRQAGLVNAGQGASAAVANAGANSANNITNNLLNTGIAQGQYGIGAANARASGIRNSYAAINRGGNNAFKVFMSFFGGGTNGIESPRGAG